MPAASRRNPRGNRDRMRTGASPARLTVELLGRRWETHVRRTRLLVGRHERWSGLTRGTERANVTVNGTKIGLRHPLYVEPRHRRARFECLRLRDPILFADALHVKPQVHRIRRA